MTKYIYFFIAINPKKVYNRDKDAIAENLDLMVKAATIPVRIRSFITLYEKVRAILIEYH